WLPGSDGKRAERFTDDRLGAGEIEVQLQRLVGGVRLTIASGSRSAGSDFSDIGNAAEDAFVENGDSVADQLDLLQNVTIEEDGFALSLELREVAADL